MAELRTFLFTDICGSVRLKGEMTGRSITEKDLAFIASVLTPHRERIESRLAEFGGRVVSTAGDGHFLVFGNTVQAAEWAAAVQESHRADPIKTPTGEAVEVRLSMHVGVPQADPTDPNNFIGKSVDYAARLNDYATGGQILVSRSVMAILDDVGLEGIRFHSHGKRPLKGIGQVEIYELLYDSQGPRALRAAPKSSSSRQWTVLPTQGFEPGKGSVAVAPALRRVGNYELEELLGSGGMGDVYKARHTQFGRVRAVKVIKPQFVAAGHSEMVRRFYNEIKAVGRLEHKNIVVAIDSSSPTDSLHYLVMEYIDGVSVEDLVTQDGPLPIAEACEIIRQAARGLQFIHKNDMVHRDIKPSNLMIALVDGDQVHSDSTLTQVGDSGERAVVKILDLGLALLSPEGPERLTRFENRAMGTGMYMSPEQWRTTSVDIRADIYSLGCTLYHLIAGNPPFFDSDLRPEKAHEKSAAPPIRSSAQPVPKKLWDVLRKMLEKRPEERYATPAEVSAALAPFCEGQQLAALVRRHIEGGAATRPDSAATVVNGSPKTDTWKSKSRASNAAFAAREWFAGAWPKVLAAVAALGLILWMFYASKQRFLAEALATAQRTMPAFARAAGGEQGKLAQDIEKRFAELGKLAADETLVEALLAHNANPGDPQPLAQMDAWIGKLTHSTGLTVESWFVDDAEGVQVARSPVSDSLKKSYRWRDYFHGQGRDFDPKQSQEFADAKPLRAPHLSVVYSSETSGKLKVALSTPIWGPAKPQAAEADAEAKEPAGDAETKNEAEAKAEANEREVIGVLGMSMNVADFEVLDTSLQGGNDVVLIDLRPDTIEGAEKSGLILHHPSQKPGEQKRIDGKLLDQIKQADPTSSSFRSEEHFLSGYRDPFDATAQRYWGAFQPVAIKYPEVADGEVEPDSPKWIVLVQKTMEE